MPRNATQPSSSFVFLASIVSVVTFHCHELERFVSCSKLCPGVPPRGHTCFMKLLLPSPPLLSNKVTPATSGPSKVLYPEAAAANGGFTDFERSVKPTGSRAKNWPTPAPITNLAGPQVSHA